MAEEHWYRIPFQGGPRDGDTYDTTQDPPPPIIQATYDPNSEAIMYFLVQKIVRTKTGIRINYSYSRSPS